MDQSAMGGRKIVAAKRRAFAERRQLVGHSQETLARFVGVEPTTVGRWERGETSLQPWCRPKLADALKVSLEELDAMLAEGQPIDDKQPGSSEPCEDSELHDADAADGLPLDPEHDPVLAPRWNHRGTVEAAVVLSGDDKRVKRRGFVVLNGAALTAPAHQWLVHEPEPLISGLSGHQVSTKLVDRFTAMTVELRKMEDIAGGGGVLALARQEFRLVAGLLDHARYDERTGRTLHIALAELGQLCGWMAYDPADRGLGQRFYVAAVRAAHSADDRSLGGYTLALMANDTARQGWRPADAVTLIETALVGTRGAQTPALLAQLHVRHAYAAAFLGDTSACTKAISQARTQAEHLAPEEEPSWLYWVSPAQIISMSGECLLQLGQSENAVAMLTEGLAHLEEPFIRDRQGYVTALARAFARPGKQRDLDVATGLGMESLDLIEGLNSTIALGYLRDLYHELKPHGKAPAVREFLDRAQGLVAV